MKLVLAGYNKNQCAQLEELSSRLGFDPEHCTDPGELLELLSSSCKTSIVMLPASEPGWNSQDLFRQLKSLRVDQALYILASSSESKGEQPGEIFEKGINDFIDLQADSLVLETKLSVAREAVREKQLHIESAEVLERYSQHIDKIAEERAKELLHAERLSTLGIMSAGIAHEINTPIGFMSTSLEAGKLYWQEVERIIAEHVPKDSLSDKQRTMLERIPKSLDRIEKGLDKVINVTEGLKGFGQSSNSKRQICEINQCVTEALEVAEHAIQKLAEVRLSLAEPSPEISGNAQQIEQVLVNLIVNAAHALEEQTGERFIDIMTAQEEGWVKLIVEDNGPGIPQEIIESIWKSFFTTKEEGKGTGLGLAISREIVRSHSGSINVRNKDSGGARFEIRLPAARKES